MVMHQTDAELDRLENLLLRQPPENDWMLLSEFDGFFAGLIVCPEAIRPSERLSLVWGDGVAPGFPSLEEYQSAIDLIMAHCNRVVRSLMPPSSGFLPVLDLDPSSDETLWELWVAGFERAMALRPECWQAIVESDDDEAAASVSLVLALHHINQGSSEFPDAAVAELDVEAPDLIPTLVESLNIWTKSRGVSSTRQPAANIDRKIRSRAKIGRNEPCSCGSGRKYNRCCGAN